MKARIDIVMEAVAVILEEQILPLQRPIKVRVYSAQHDFGKDDNLTLTIPQIPKVYFADPTEAPDA